ncbi:MAG TPA: glycosyltransferase [Thermoanaerobaculia bacterium]|jgi:GT2 family glycosyltransferase
MSDVAVIVVDIGGGAMLRACLDSIAAQTLQPAEVVVWDNSETNVGFTGGNNEAWKRTTAAFVALVNNDVVLDPDWLETVRGAMGEDVGAVQTMFRGEAAAGIDISDGTIRQLVECGGHAAAVGAEERRHGRRTPEPWGVSATAALYRREAVGDRPFDPRFFAYYEDVELCARLHESGWRTIVLPVVKASHRGSASASVLGKDAQRLRTRNRYFVARLHPGVGRIGALLWEDAKLLVRGRASLRGLVEGLFTRL